MTPQVGGWRHAAVGGRAKNRMQESIAATAAKTGEHGRRVVVLEVMPDHARLFVKSRPQRALRSARTVQRHLRARDERAPKGGGCA
ncbi:hypothetical protein SMD20_38340 [Nonomuraea sp. LP-02]|uniref:hypothetical protein n=1 Tax=Nonomuraea sp. LP-02 TaxID=3097960 RepID=UPI002E2ED200|nr:hypothetical protein [Nonomuraea sp. LP-02]MED7930143.1 hypothetical protein [Nonomuraea sp. LP-02]